MLQCRYRSSTGETMRQRQKKRKGAVNGARSFLAPLTASLLSIYIYRRTNRRWVQMLQKSVAVSTLAMLVDIEKHTLDAARVVHYTTVPERAAYRSSVLTPLTPLTPHKRQLL